MPSSVSSLVNKDGPAPLFDVLIDRVGHLANQKRVRQARDQRSVTQRMRRKLAGIFCFVTVFFFNEGHGPIMALVFLHGDWRTQTKIKFSPRFFFWCFFRGCSSPKAEQVERENDRGRVSRHSFNLF